MLIREVIDCFDIGVTFCPATLHSSGVECSGSKTNAKINTMLLQHSGIPLANTSRNSVNPNSLVQGTSSLLKRAGSMRTVTIMSQNQVKLLNNTNKEAERDSLGLLRQSVSHLAQLYLKSPCLCQIINDSEGWLH